MTIEEALALALCEAWGNRPHDRTALNWGAQTYLERERRVVAKVIPIMKTLGFDLAAAPASSAIEEPVGDVVKTRVVQYNPSNEVNLFLRDLSEIGRKHGFGITGEAFIYVLERDDTLFNYSTDENSKLYLGSAPAFPVIAVDRRAVLEDEATVERVAKALHAALYPWQKWEDLELELHRDSWRKQALVAIRALTTSPSAAKQEVK